MIQQTWLPTYRVPVYRELAGRQGIDLRLIYDTPPGGPRGASADGFDARIVSSRRLRVGGRTVKWIPAQVAAASGVQADVLIMAWTLNNASLVPALVRARRRGVRTVLWGHGYSKREAGWRVRLRDRVGGLASAVMFYNEAAAEAAVARGMEASRVFVAPNALDQSPIQDARRWWDVRSGELDSFQSSHDLDGRAVVLYVSRLEPANRLELLIDAVHRLGDRHNNVLAVVVGEGADERRRLESLVSERGLGHHVRWVGAEYDEQRLALWMMSASVFCYPMNIGLSVLHAFGYGLPVVTSDSIDRQNPEIEAVEHERNGLLYSGDDVASLASALDRCLTDSSLMESMRKEALRTVQERYTLSNMVDGMVAAIKGGA